MLKFPSYYRRASLSILKMLTQGLSLSSITGIQRDLPLLVFLPGMDGSALSLQQQSDELKNRFDARCFCIPGNNMTDWPGLVARLIELVSLEKVQQPDRLIYLCGESFGACLALKAICDAPDLFDCLILINPASSFNRQIWSPLGALAVKWMPGNAYYLAAVGLIPFLVSFERVSSDNRQALLRAMQQVIPAAAAWRLSLLNNFQFDRAAIAQFCGPTLLIASAADRLLPSILEVRQLKRVLNNVQAITLDHSGHACLLETGISLHQLLRQAQLVPRVDGRRSEGHNYAKAKPL